MEDIEKKIYVEPVLRIETVEMEQGIGVGSVITIGEVESIPKVENDTYCEIIGHITSDW